MPKESKIQSSFIGGMVSKSVYGRVDSPKYDMSLALAKNYLPTLQGPMIRRPGTKYVTTVTNSTQPPSLIPFQFSATQNSVFELGDKYIRFYTNEGQIVTNTTSFLVAGIYAIPGTFGAFNISAIRASPIPHPGETFTSSSVITAGSILQLSSPYAWTDTAKIKYAQKNDTVYLTHPNYLPSKLIRTGFNTWDFKQVIFQDGPYLPLNSYLSAGDAANIQFTPSYDFLGSSFISIATSPNFSVTAAFADGSSAVTITAPGHNFTVGNKVFVGGINGATSLNNVNNANGGVPPVFTNSSISQAYWVVSKLVGSSSLDLQGASLNAPMTGSSGFIFPAIFQLISGSSGQYWNDVQVSSSSLGTPASNGIRNIGLVIDGTRYWGIIQNIEDSAHAIIDMGIGQQLPTSAIQSSVIWQMGVFSNLYGWPATTCFHQDRLVFAGTPGVPQEFDASMTADYEVFSASGSNNQVNNNNALQFSLSSQDLNAIRWIKSSTQGMLAGTQSSEWSIAPSTQSPSLTPTSINATECTYFGSADVDAIGVGNAVLYIQRAQRKVRELLYYWQVGNFRSSNMSELSETITLPAITKLVNQKEIHPQVWALRSDGALLSMAYNRDDVTLQANAAWAYHILGGQSDSAATPPVVTSMAVIPSGDTTYDELWMVVKRYINGSSVTTIEYMTKPFDDVTPQYLSYHFDAGSTYNVPIAVTGISQNASTVITAPAHGLSNSSTIRFYNTVGINFNSIDANGNATIKNQLNGNTYVVTSTAVNTFMIQDFLGNYINTSSSTVYVGSAVVNRLVSSITGINWLANEIVGIVADGGIVANTTVSSIGTLNLPYPAAIVSFGYPYNSDGQMLRTHDGSAQGTSIGSTRRVNRVAFMLHNVGDFSYGPSFTRLIPAEFENADANNADTAPALFDGIHRDGIESDYGFDDMTCFRQSSGLPGMVQAVTRFLEENDV